MKDRSFKLLLACIAVALWAVVLRPVWEPTPAQAQGGTTGPAKYEYLLTFNDDLGKMETELDKAGQNGWRSVGVAVNPQDGFRSPEILVLLERRIQ